MKVGVDLSHWQASVDLAKADETLDFVFLKATESTSYVDPTFGPRWRALDARSMPRGAYHFGHPASPASAQAAHFLSIVGPTWQEGDVAILDLEGTAAALATAGHVRPLKLTNDTITSTRQDVPWEALPSRAMAPSPAQLANWAKTWLSAVQAELGGVPVLYTFPSFYRDTMGNPDLRSLGAVGWLARYAPDPWQEPWTRLNGWPDVPAIWQCSNGTSGCVTDVPGVGKVDFDRMTDAAWWMLFGPKAGLSMVAGVPSLQTRAEAEALLAEGGPPEGTN